MKILFPLGAFYPSQIGGPCNTLYWHTCALKKNDFDTTIITTMLGIDEKNVNEEQLYETNCGRVYYGKGKSGNVKTIKKALNNIKHADVVHLNSLFDIISIISFFYIKAFTSKPIVWSVRGELNKNALVYSPLKKRVLLSIYRLFLSRVYFHSTSEQETHDIKSIFPKADVFYIPNFIKASEFVEATINKQFLFMGRIHPIKAIDKLIEALSLSRNFMESDFKLIIAGKHEERHEYYLHELKTQIKRLDLENKIEFLGHKVGYEKELLYASSYYTILPSESENFGNVVVESLAQGTPVIASLGTPWSVLETYNCGKHVANAPETLAGVIDAVIAETDSNYKEIRKNAIKVIDAEFNVDSQIIRWISKYKDIYYA